MKITLKSFCIGVFIATALIFTSCKDDEKKTTTNVAEVQENEQSTNPTKKSIKDNGQKADGLSPDSIPASGAKTFITNHFGVSSIIRNIDDELDIDELQENILSAIDLEKLSTELENALEDNPYIDNLEKLFEKGQQQFEKNAESFYDDNKIDFKFAEKPGKAENLPEGMALDIPEITVTAKGFIDDIDEPNKGELVANINTSAHAQIDKIKVDINTISANANVKLDKDIVKKALSLDGTVSDKINFTAETDGVYISLKNFDNDVNVKASFDSEKGNGTLTMNNNIASVFKFDAKEFGAPDCQIKYLFIDTKVNGNLSGTPGFDSTKNNPLSGTVNFNYKGSTDFGMSFVAQSGTGGKAILKAEYALKSEQNLENIEQIMESILNSVASMFGEQKLSEEEFNKLSVPLSLKVSIKFYDDNNNETLNFVDLANTYQVYCYIYDIGRTLGMDPDDIAYEIENLLEDFTFLF